MDNVTEQSFKHVVIENFLEDPESVRQSAISAGFGKWQPNKGDTGDDYYRGLGFYGNHAPCWKAVIKTLNRAVYPNANVFRATNLDTEPATIHSDIQAGDFACIVYLSKHEDGESGTKFYKHKGTGLFHSPKPSNANVSDREYFKKLMNEGIARSPEVWEEVGFVQGKYNRAVIFPAAQWHSRYPNNGFGENVDEARIVWVGQFYV